MTISGGKSPESTDAWILIKLSEMMPMRTAVPSTFILVRKIFARIATSPADVTLPIRGYPKSGIEIWRTHGKDATLSINP